MDPTGTAERAASGTSDAAAAGTAAGQSAAPAGDGAADAGDNGGVDVDAVRRELEEHRDRYLRLAAEYDNYRKRMQRERTEAGQRAQAELVRPLLDTLDDLVRFSHVDPATATAQSMVEAVAMVERKLSKALAAAGLEVVNPVGEPYDPAQHEALATAPASSAEEDSTVAQVYQPGYVFGGQLLRPARVVVRQWNG